MHVRSWHSVSVPTQSAGTLQPTQLPSPSHTRSAPAPHAVSAGRFVFIGTPATQMSAVQSFESFGSSSSSIWLAMAPAPSQTLVRQFPAT